MGKIYSFTHNQLKTLLKGCGYDHVAGLDISTETLGNETVLNSLNELTKSGVICSDSKAFQVDDAVKKKIDVLGSSRCYTIIHSNRIDLPDKCLFVSDEVLVCTGRIADKKRISLEFVDKDTLFEDLFEEEYLKLCDSELSINEEELEEFETGIFAFIDPNMPLSSGGVINFSMEELDIDGQLLRFLRVIDYYFYTYIVYCEDGKLVREICNKEKVKTYFDKMVSL